MKPLTLRIKFKDSLMLAIKNLWLALLLGVGLATYQGNINAGSLPLILLLITGALTLATFTVWAIPYLELTGNGINFKNWRGRNEFCRWDSKLTLELKKHGGSNVYLLNNVSLKKEYKIPTVLFSYPEAQSYININAPACHPLRDLVGVAS
ncbi:MAG: hypothetical protein ACI9W6_001820 [Motiliproteus sp.]|jgi:hypothetical protein